MKSSYGMSQYTDGIGERIGDVVGAMVLVSKKLLRNTCPRFFVSGGSYREETIEEEEDGDGRDSGRRETKRKQTRRP